MDTHQRHPLSECWPDPQADERAELRESLTRHGFLSAFPLVLHDDKVLDGWQRYGLCVELDIEPITVAYDGDDPAGFVIGAHRGRRNLTAEQRAEGALRCREWRKPGAPKKGEPEPMTDSEIAAEAGVGIATIGRAKKKIRNKGERPQPQRKAAAPAPPTRRRTLFQMRGNISFKLSSNHRAHLIDVPTYGAKGAVALTVKPNPEVDAEWQKITTAALALNEKHEKDYQQAMSKRRREMQKIRDTAEGACEAIRQEVLKASAAPYAAEVADLHRRTTETFAKVGKADKVPRLKRS